MACDSCGRYRPPDEVTAIALARGRILWVCAGCRNLRSPGRIGAVPTTSPRPAMPAPREEGVLAVPR